MYSDEFSYTGILATLSLYHYTCCQVMTRNSFDNNSLHICKLVIMPFVISNTFQTSVYKMDRTTNSMQIARSFAWLRNEIWDIIDRVVAFQNIWVMVSNGGKAGLR